MRDILSQTGFVFRGHSSLPVLVGDFPSGLMSEMLFENIVERKHHVKPAKILKRFESSAAIEQFLSGPEMTDFGTVAPES